MQEDQHTRTDFFRKALTELDSDELGLVLLHSIAELPWDKTAELLLNPDDPQGAISWASLWQYDLDLPEELPRAWQDFCRILNQKRTLNANIKRCAEMLRQAARRGCRRLRERAKQENWL
jgi:hypothetical protein